jgi:hypothetical protein
MIKFQRLLCAAACLLPVACTTPGGGRAGMRMLDRDQHIAAATALDGTVNGACLSNIAYPYPWNVAVN